MSKKEILEFPCNYPIKAMGLNDETFIQSVVGIISRHTGEVKNDSMEAKLSNKNKYISLTVNVYAESREFLEKIYKDLQKCKLVLMVL